MFTNKRNLIIYTWQRGVLKQCVDFYNPVERKGGKKPKPGNLIPTNASFYI